MRGKQKRGRGWDGAGRTRGARDVTNVPSGSVGKGNGSVAAGTCTARCHSVDSDSVAAAGVADRRGGS